MAVVLLCVHLFVADLARCSFVGVQDCSYICGIGSRRMWQHQPPGYRNTETAVLSLIRFTAGLHVVRTGV